MHIFNQYTPWLLTCLSIFSVATGMSASPAMMVLSSAPEGYEGWVQEPVAFSGKIEDCPGELGQDGVYKVAGLVNDHRNPYFTTPSFSDLEAINRYASMEITHQ